MLLRFVRALIFMCFLGLCLMGLASYLGKIMPMAETFSAYHLVAALVWGFLLSYLYKKGLDYNELKENRDDQVRR